MKKLIPSFARRLLKLPFTLPLRFRFIRRPIAYEMLQWFGDLEIEVPLTENMACPIGEWGALYSFSEIFVTNEYAPFFEVAPLPRRLLDLGCHVGYFSLYMAWKNAMAGRADEWSALLVDADPRMAPLVAQTMRRNRMERQAIFKPGIISEGSGEREFALRRGMDSSSDITWAPAQSVCRVPCITADEIAAIFPPPYDVIKVDIEGAEYDFIRNYPQLCRGAEHLLIEWHSHDREGSRAAELRELCAKAGFEFVRETRGKMEVCSNGAWNSSAVELYRRK